MPRRSVGRVRVKFTERTPGLDYVLKERDKNASSAAELMHKPGGGAVCACFLTEDTILRSVCCALLWLCPQLLSIA
jgi:hypothetical protein